MKVFLKILELLFLFALGGLIYISLELIYKGSTNYIMFCCGGISLICIGAINEVIPWNMPIQYQCLIGCIFITLLELITGLMFNRDFLIWDYRNMPLNFMGQICPAFSLLWYVLSGVAIVIDDYIRYLVFKEDKPHYTLR